MSSQIFPVSVLEYMAEQWSEHCRFNDPQEHELWADESYRKYCVTEGYRYPNRPVPPLENWYNPSNPFTWMISIDEANQHIECLKGNHKWMDDSSCGPDSGDMDMYCAVCGATFHHQLY